MLISDYIFSVVVCFGLNFCVSPKFYAEILTHNVMVPGCRAFAGVIRL